MKIIITSGGSQLLTQIASLLTLSININKYKVYYIGKEIKELNEIINSICNYYKLNFKGTISTIPFVPLFSNRNFFRIENLKYLLDIKNVYQALYSQLSILKDLEGSEVVIPFRNKVQRDIFLLAGIKPTKVILTADGVIDEITPRNANSWRWYGIKTPINQIPVSQEIFTPSYLSKDTKKAGPINIIPDDILFNVFKEVGRIPQIKILEKEVFQLGIPNAIIFSQHLALINACTKDIEIELYTDIINDLIKKKTYPIIFKPHPRETKEKITQLKNQFLEHRDKIIFLSEKAKVAPIEVLVSKFEAKKIQLVTLSSSAPLCMPSMGSKIFTYSASYLPKSLKREIANYTEKYNCQNILIE